MHTHLTSRLGRWRRLVQYWDTAAAAWQAQVACGWINLLERLPLRESGRQSNKPHAVQLELDPLEARFFPGQTAGVAGALGWSLTEAGLARVDQAVVRSTEPAPLRHSARLWSHADSVGAGDLLAFSRPNIFWSPETARLPSTDSTVAAHQVSLQGAPDTGRTIAPDPLADPFVDVLTGESMRPKPPPRAAGDGMPDRHHGADGGGGGGGRSSSAGAVGNDANVSRPLSPATTFNLDGSPITGAGPSKTTIQPAPLNGHSNGGSAAPGKGHKSAAGADPLWVLDMNKGLVLTPGVPGHEFSNWSMDLQAQVSGATVSSYSWDLTQASDATGVTGASTFELKFTWASFTGAPHTDTISVTETPTVGSPITQSYTFEVISTSSAAYTATAPTSSATWATVLAPDQLRTEETAGQSPYFQLGLATGELQTSHQLPSYNPNVPALQLEYSSAMADPKPVFIVHYQLDPAQSSVPSWVSAQLSAFPNHSANQVYYYNTSSLNPGDIMEIALQGDASGLTAGSEYAYTITVKANYATQTTNTYTGTYHAVNSSGAFGPGWSIAGLQQLWAPADGAIVQEGSGQGLFFGAPPSTAFGDGHYVSPPGDFTNLVGKVDGTGYRTYPDGRQINFSTTGLQTSVVDPNNNTTGYSYNGQQLTAITDLNNQLVTFSYNGSGQVTSIRDPANRLTTFAYDGSGRLQSIRDADGALWTYAYDGISNRIASVTDPRGNITSVAYNFAGRVATVTRPDNTTEQLSAVQMQGLVQAGQGTQGSPATPVLVAQAQSQYTDPRGNVWQTSLDWLGFGARTALTAPLAGATVVTLNYRDANGLAWMTSDPLGHRYRRFFDASGNPTTVVQPDGSSWQYVYNSFSEVTQATDPLGDMTTFSYDANGNLIKRKDALNNVTTYTNTTQGLRATEQDARGNTTSYAYDSLNRLTTVTNALGGLATTAYDSAGRVIRSTDALGHGTSYAYDAMNRVTAVTDALGKTTTSLYDPAGNLQAKIDPLNHQVSYAYDSLNRLIQTTDPLGGIATVIYDEAGNVKARIDALGHRVSYAYDGLNRQTQITDALSHTTTTAYDLAGNVTSVTDARGNTTATSYDALNRVVTVTDPLNHTVTTVYDAAGNVTRTIDALNNATTMGYDALNRLITIQDPTGGVATTLYDPVGNVQARVDALGHALTYTYDQLNRQTQVQDARNGLTTTAYDAVGNVISIKDPVSNLTSFAYDADNRLTQQTDPSNRSSTFAYDDAGRMTSTTDRNGRRRDFTYDNKDRKTGEAWVVSGSTVNLLTFTYDAADRLVTAANAYSLYTMSYDNADRMTAVQEPFGLALTFTLDAVGHRQVVQDSLGGVTTSAYDVADRLTLRQFGGSGQTPLRVDVGYSVRNQMTAVTRSSDLAGTQHVGSSLYTYDGAMRLTNLQHKDGSNTVLANYTYTYDLADRLTAQTVNGTATSYGYDVTNQVTSDGTANYTYNLNGNRTMAGYQTGAANKLTNDGTWTYTYDNEGNLTKKSKGASAETWTYGFDNLNHMVWARDSATDGGAATTLATYVYDVMGNRIEKDVWTQSSGTTAVSRFGFDFPTPPRGQGQGQGLGGDGNLWADLNGSNALQTRYLRGDQIDQLFARISAAGTAAWYLTDWQGSVRNLTDASGNLQDTLSYDAFGNVLNESNTSAGDRFKFTSRELDSETGLQYNRARYYDPKVGRFISQDPTGFSAGDGNLYRYVHNGPTDAGDPSGLGPVSQPAFLAAPGRDSNWDYPWRSRALSTAPYQDYRDWFQRLTDGAAGFGDGASFGLTRRIRQAGGFDDAVHSDSPEYQVAQVGGMIVSTGAGMGCGLGGMAINGIQAVGGALNVADDIAAGDWGQAGLDGLGVLANAAGFLRAATACFAAGTPLLTPTGDKLIEQFRPGDWILSASEFNPEATPEPKQVQEVFTNVLPLLHLHVGGQVIRTTAEHPFFVRGEGWRAARLLQAGQSLRSHDDRWLKVDDVRQTDEVAPVYNLRVADYHTYWVGSRDWGFSVWTHNACRLDSRVKGVRAPGRYDTSAGSLDEARQIVRTALPDAVELEPAIAGQPYPSPPPGTQQWFQVHPPEPSVGNNMPHFKYADWTAGKKGSGGSWGHIFFPSS